MSMIAVVALITTASALFAVGGYLLMRQKFGEEIKKGKVREEELRRKIYETAVLKELGERIGYSLDASKIIEIISGSLGDLLPFSTVCHLILDDKEDKLHFSCHVAESVSPDFVRDVKAKMINASREMMQRPIMESEVDERISGNILDENAKEPVASYFNLPIVIADKMVGVITVASTRRDLYDEENTAVLYRIAKQASEAVTKLQEVLEQEKTRLSQAVQSLADGLLMVDTKFHLILVNKKLTQLLGTVPAPSLFDIVNALSGKFDLRSKMEEAFATDDELPFEEIEVKGKTLQVVTSRVVDKKLHKPTGVVVSFHDFTDARALEKLRQDFTSMMVHELRAPLTNIKSTADLLRGQFEKLKGEEIQKYLASVDETSVAMLELVADLLDVAKMESGRFDVICDAGDLGAIIEERAEIFKSQAEGKGLKLVLAIENNMPRAYFDRVRIKQVFNNLLSNALKFTRSGEITIKAQEEKVNGEGRDILVSICDTGIGIDPEEGRFLFSRFGQLVRGRQAAALKGSGLGLFIAKGIVEAWGGKIWFKSEGAGMGSTFYFTVPLALNIPKEKVKDEKAAAIGFATQKVAHG